MISDIRRTGDASRVGRRPGRESQNVTSAG